MYLDERFGTPNHLGFDCLVLEAASNLTVSVDGKPGMIHVINFDNSITTDLIIPQYLVDDITRIEVKDNNKSYYNSLMSEASYTPSIDDYGIEISYKKLSEITQAMYQDRYAISLIVNDKIDADLLIASLDNTTYQILTYSPPLIDGISVLKQVISMFVFGGAILGLLFLYAILGLVIRNSMNARKKDFAIFRSIGTNEKTVGRLVIYQQIFISLFAYISLMIIVAIMTVFVPTSFIDFRMLPWYSYLVLFIMFMLFSIWLGFRFNKRIFKITVIKNLQIEEVI